MIELVRVNPDYIEALRKVDDKVQSNSPMQGKETKPFVGILFTLKENGITYYAPLSSPKAKHQSMPNGSDFHKVLDSNGNLLSVINFNNMIPVSKNLCSKIDFSTDKDRTLLQKEYLYCIKNEDLLKNKAKQVYKRYYAGQLSEKERERTCDFRVLEKELQRYLQVQNVVLNETAKTQDTSKSEQSVVESKKSESQQLDEHKKVIPALTSSDNSILKRISDSAKGSMFDSYFSGRSTIDKNQASHFVLRTLAFFSNFDKGAMERIFKNSKLYDGDNNKLNKSIGEVIAGFFSGSGSGSGAGSGAGKGRGNGGDNYR